MKSTVVYELNQLNTNKLYIKRDDLLPYSFGGNKARKATLFFKEIDKGNYDCVVTYGSSSSNHCRIVANMAAERKIPCYIISPEEEYKETFNSKLVEIFGAIRICVPVELVHDSIERKLHDLIKEGKNPYFIAGGGHGNIGTQAYVDCYKEILKYEKENKIFFDYIFLASGTGTTQAGLVCGQILNNDDRTIVGISIARENPRGRNVVINSIKEYLGRDSFDEDKVIFVDDFTADGYGKQNDEINNTIKSVMINFGIPLDATYTGKAFYGMQQYMIEKDIKDKNILFIHTGGTPLFFDDIEIL